MKISPPHCTLNIMECTIKGHTIHFERIENSVIEFQVNETNSSIHSVYFLAKMKNYLKPFYVKVDFHNFELLEVYPFLYRNDIDYSLDLFLNDKADSTPTYDYFSIDLKSEDPITVDTVDIYRPNGSERVDRYLKGVLTYYAKFDYTSMRNAIRNDVYTKPFIKQIINALHPRVVANYYIPKDNGEDISTPKWLIVLGPESSEVYKQTAKKLNEKFGVCKNPLADITAKTLGFIYNSLKGK